MNDINNQSPNLIGDAYRNYLIEDAKTLPNMSKEKMTEMGFRLTREEFINKIKTDEEFAKTCEVKVEVRELSEDERYDLLTQQMRKLRTIRDEDYINYNIPTREISLTYNNRTEVIYEV
jgi:hypothetical protein